ncbi:GFA family protein, partial [Candidatus Poribacteria bacterium]|nr:GFA family protein [Candidatus Poribacteria bacterium]
METIIIEGGCFCGEVRYRATQAPSYTSVCHCSNCRHACASPLPAFVAFGTDNLETDKFSFIKGEPVRYRYTSEMFWEEMGRMMWSEWWFCGRCGTRLAHIHEGLTDDTGRVLQVSVTTCTLDNPEAYPPKSQGTI